MSAHWTKLLLFFTFLPLSAMGGSQNEFCFETKVQPSYVIRWNGDNFSKSVDVIEYRSSCENFKWQQKMQIGIPLIKVTTEEAIKVIGIGSNEAKKFLRIIEILKRGGTDYFEETINPISYSQQLNARGEAFTSLTNAELSKKYGVAFSARTYLNWLKKQFKNQMALDIFEPNFLNFYTDNSKQLRFHKMSSNKVPLILIQNGHGGRDADWAMGAVKEVFKENLATESVEVKILERDPTGLIQRNVELIEPQIVSYLEDGRDIYLLSFSKGSQEVFRAIINIQKKYSKNQDRQEFAQGWGHIRGNLSLMPLFSGSVLSDFAQRYQATKYVISFLGALRKQFGQYAPESVLYWTDYIVNGATLSTKEIETVQTLMAPGYPKDIVNLAVAHVPFDGLVGQSEKQTIGYKFQKILRTFGAVNDANDNFIAAPGSMFPAPNPRTYNMAFSASHALLDGEVEVNGSHYPLAMPNTHKAYFKALLQTLLVVEKQHLILDATRPN